MQDYGVDAATGGGVSVVIPVRNGSATIGAQLAALAAQRGAPAFEIVVSDNGSTDDTVEVVERSRALLPTGVQLRVVSCPEVPGVSHARNSGVRAASGDVLLICDSDDVVSEQWLSEMVAASAEFDTWGGSIRTGLLNPKLFPGLSPDIVEENPKCVGRPYSIGANTGLHRRVFDAIGGWDEGFFGGGDDADFSFRAVDAGFRLGFARDAIIEYRVRTRPKAVFLQYYRYGRMNAFLLKRHGGRPDAGSSLPSSAAAAGRGARALIGMPLALMTDPALRRKRIGQFGWKAGRTVGRIKARSWEPSATGLG